jgi:hypothetical protein
MVSQQSIAKHITAAATTPVIDHSVYVFGVIISCSGAGLTLVIQDRSGTPLKLVPGAALTVPANGMPLVLDIHNIPAYMSGGIDIVSTGTGIVDVWTTISEQSS